MNLDVVRDVCSDLLDNARACFKPGAKATLLIRFPGKPELDFMLTDDDLDKVLNMVQRSQKREAQ